MKYLRQLHNVKPNGFTRTLDGKTLDIYLSVFGIFDTERVSWSYYYSSCYDSAGHTYITNDCAKMTSTTAYANVMNISSYGHSVKNPEDGVKFCEEFKMKWETGSNDLISEIRDKKLNQLLD
jgi:hypothetical protein